MAVDIKRVHERLLEMAKVTASILEKHEIPYSISYGNLLGAVRHKGFIPWDGDFDFWLFDNTYDTAIDCLRKELPANIFVEDKMTEPNYFHAWVHVKDLKSSVYQDLFPQDNLYAHKGLILDLYRLKRLKLNEFANYRNTENRSYIMRRKALGLMDEEEYQRRMAALIKNEERVKMFPETDDREVFANSADRKWVYFEIRDILPLKKIVFEDTVFWGPHNPNKVLADFYGDYMKLPPVEERKFEYSSVSFLEG